MNETDTSSEPQQEPHNDPGPSPDPESPPDPGPPPFDVDDPRLVESREADPSKWTQRLDES